MKLGIEAATTGIKPPKAFCSSMFATIGLPDPLAEKKTWQDPSSEPLTNTKTDVLNQCTLITNDHGSYLSYVSCLCLRLYFRTSKNAFFGVGVGWGGVGGGNNVLVTTLLMLRCQLVEVTSKTLWMPRCWHVEVTSTTLWMLRCWHVEVMSENASEDLFKKTGTMMKQMWADLRCEKTCIVCRAGIMLEQIKFPLSVNVVFTGFWAKMDEFESTFFDPFFQDVPNSHFLLVFTVFFKCPHFRCVKTLARFQIRGGYLNPSVHRCLLP